MNVPSWLLRFLWCNFQQRLLNHRNPVVDVTSVCGWLRATPLLNLPLLEQTQSLMSLRPIAGCEEAYAHTPAQTVTRAGGCPWLPYGWNVFRSPFPPPRFQEAIVLLFVYGTRGLHIMPSSRWATVSLAHIPAHIFLLSLGRCGLEFSGHTPSSFVGLSLALV